LSSSRIPELVKDLNDVVRVHFYDMRRALHDTGNNGLRGLYRKHLVPFQDWNSKTVAQQSNSGCSVLISVAFISKSALFTASKRPLEPNIFEIIIILSSFLQLILFFKWSETLSLIGSY
jgi:hypothetical protein